MSLYRFPEQVPYKRLPRYSRLTHDQMTTDIEVLEHLNRGLKDPKIRENKRYKYYSIFRHYDEYGEFTRVGIYGHILGVIDPRASYTALSEWNHQLQDNDEFVVMKTGVYGNDQYPLPFGEGGTYGGMPVRARIFI